MKTIEDITTQAAQVLVFEKPETLTMLSITIDPKESSEDTKPYQIQIPKAFLEEVVRLQYEEGWKDGYDEGLYDNHYK